MCSFRRIISSLSLCLGDHVGKLILLVHCSFVSSELLSSNLTSLLLFGGDTSSDKLHHSLLERGESGNLPDNLSDSKGSLGNFTLHGDWPGLPCHLGGSGN